MRKALKQWRLRWHQRALEGAHSALHRHQRWGFTSETLTALDASIRPFLDSHYSAVILRQAKAPLYTATIDHLMADLGEAARTMTPNPRGERGVVSERLQYTVAQVQSLHSYLTTVDGRGLSPTDAWPLFHRTALELAQTLESMYNEEDANTDLFYFTHRYGLLWQEVLAVYRLFAQLAGFTLPPFA